MGFLNTIARRVVGPFLPTYSTETPPNAPEVDEPTIPGVNNQDENLRALPPQRLHVQEVQPVPPPMGSLTKNTPQGGPTVKILVVGADQPQYTSEFKSTCAASNVPFAFGNDKLISDIETEELYLLKDPNSASYKTLYSTFESIGREHNCNIMLIVGHGHMCINYLIRYKSEILKLAENNYPSVVFTIGCKTAMKMVDLYVGNDYKQRRIFVFGFEGVVHVLSGVIQMCETWDTKKKTYICSSDNVPIPKKERMECCEARWEEAKRKYIEQTMPKRQCVVYSKDALVKIIQKVKTNTNEFIDLQTLDTNLLKINFNDGIPCSETSACMSMNNISQLTNISKKYNEKLNPAQSEEEVQAIQKITEILRKTDVLRLEMLKKTQLKNGVEVPIPIEVLRKYIENEKKVFDRRIIEELNKLPHDTALRILNKKVNFSARGSKLPIFFVIILLKFKSSTKKIINEFPNVAWDTMVEGSEKGEFQGLIHTLFQKTHKFSDAVPHYQYSLKELYRLFKDIIKVNKDFFWVQNSRGRTLFGEMITMRNTEGEFFPLLEFYFDNFSPEEYDYNKHNSESGMEGLMESALFHPTSEISNAQIRLVSLLFSYGFKPSPRVSQILINSVIPLNRNITRRIIKRNLSPYNRSYNAIEKVKTYSDEKIKEILHNVPTLQPRKKQMKQQFLDIFTSKQYDNEGLNAIRKLDQMNALSSSLRSVPYTRPPLLPPLSEENRARRNASYKQIKKSMRNKDRESSRAARNYYSQRRYGGGTRKVSKTLAQRKNFL